MNNHNNKGFTLIELLVVMVILGLLGGLVGPQVMKHLRKAKADTASLQIKDIEIALDMFYLDNGRYPAGHEGLDALVQTPANMANWNGPYLKKTSIPKDPWGIPFYYTSPGQHGIYDLYSLGADKVVGGEQDKRDIQSWE